MVTPEHLVVTCPICAGPTHPDHLHVGGAGYVFFAVCDADVTHRAIRLDRQQETQALIVDRRTLNIVSADRCGCGMATGAGRSVHWCPLEPAASFAVHFDGVRIGAATGYLAGEAVLDDYCTELIAQGLMCSVAPMDEQDATDMECEMTAHDPFCVVFCPFADIELDDQHDSCPQGHGSHDCSCAELDEDRREQEAGAVASSESGPPCGTCGDPATTTIHGFAFCQPCGEDAQQALDDAPPAVDTEHDPAAVRASILWTQTALMAPKRVLWKRRTGKRASRVRSIEAELLAWDATTATVRTLTGHVATVPHADVVRLANWNSDAQEAA